MRLCVDEKQRKKINLVELYHASLHEDVWRAVKVHCTISNINPGTADEMSLYCAVVVVMGGGGDPGGNGSQFNNETTSEDGPNTLPPKRLSFTRQQGVISKKPWIFINTAVRILKVAQRMPPH
jgi:hypothetical protein